MVEIPKIEEKKYEPAPSVLMSSPQVKPEDVIVELDTDEGKSADTAAVVRKPKSDPIAEIRERQESAERALVQERELRQSAERERDTARVAVDATRANLAKSESEKVVAQEQAVATKIETAKAEVENAERALEEAIDTGKPAKEQIRLQKMLAESVYKLKGAEGAKVHFDNWKEREKNKQVAAPKEEMTRGERWIKDHPRFNSDKDYKRAAIAAHADALVDNIEEGSDEYFRRINAAVADFEKDSSPAAGSVRKTSSATSTAAPASHDSTGVGASGGTAAEEKRTGRRTFTLDDNMRHRALQQYGKNSSFKLSDDEAYKRYAQRQLEIRDKRANGERI